MRPNTTNIMPKFNSRISRTWIRIKVISSLFLFFFKEMYELITGRRKWS